MVALSIGDELRPACHVDRHAADMFFSKDTMRGDVTANTVEGFFGVFKRLAVA